MKKISKEENMRLRKRTGERLEIATAKANLWKKFREGKDDLNERDLAAWEGIRTSVMELEKDGRWRNNEEGDEQLDKVNLVMRRGKLLGGQVRDAAQVGGDVRERDGEGLHVDVDADGMRDKAGQEIEGGQEQEDGVQEGDQSDQSVLTGVSESRW